MASLRKERKKIEAMLHKDNWRSHISEIASQGMASVGPLFSLLPGKPELAHRAACTLGATVAKIEENEPEKARNIVRRFMWHMSEESGNIGWGIPAAFAETLSASHALAEIYRNILVSYIIDLGHDDNFCDNDILRRSCYEAIGRFAIAWPELAEKAHPWLVKGLADRDGICRGMAAWALSRLKPELSDVPALKKLLAENDQSECAIFDGDKMRLHTVQDLAQMALDRI